MKNIVSYINESKEKPLYTDYDIHRYINIMIEHWINDMRDYNVILSGVNVFSKIELCRRCEIILDILESVSDVVHLHFIDAASEEDQKNYEYCTPENMFYRAFSIINAIVGVKSVDVGANKEEESLLKSEIAELSQRVEKLVKDCNAKFKKSYQENKEKNKNTAGIGCPTECCKSSLCY